MSTLQGETVLVLGAGASVAEAAWHRPKRRRDHPPLDLNFFRHVETHAQKILLRRVIAHAKELGISNLCGADPPISLEAHLGRLFFEMNRTNSKRARSNYYDLVTIYSDELRHTTEWMDTRSGAIRRVVERELDTGNRVSVITFNHDLLVENALSLIGSRHGKVWCLRHAYGFDPHETCENAQPTFPYDCPGGRSDHIPVYKLHGSLNWVFKTRDSVPPRAPRTRDLLIWINRVIPAYTRKLTVEGTRRDWYLWSLIIPPIYEKQGFIRDELEQVWSMAADALRRADKVVVWGYSFPPADVHARYFFQAAAYDNENLRTPVMINPDAAAHAALWQVMQPRHVTHFRYVTDYLAAA